MSIDSRHPRNPILATPASRILPRIELIDAEQVAQFMAGHASARTTQLYDRRDETVTLDEVERVQFRRNRN